MQATETIVNKVAQSGLITFDLETLLPTGQFQVLDMKDYMFQGLILREKEFRAFVKEHEWEQYTDKYIAITCSTDAIVPTWAYVLLANRLTPFASEVVFGNINILKQTILRKAIDKLDLEQYRNAKVLIKGCSTEHIPEDAYIYLTSKLSQTASSIMYGEACSSVPIFKRKK